MLKFQAESFMMKPATDFSALYLPLPFGTRVCQTFGASGLAPQDCQKKAYIARLLPSPGLCCWQGDCSLLK